MTHTPLLVVGAGPFGLALSAYARRHGLDHVLVGEPMRFWTAHMPKGMLLRSGVDWHYDPFDEDTIERYLEVRGIDPAEVDPLGLEVYLGYAAWFRERKGITALARRVERLDADEARGGFAATLDTGEVMAADRVVLALGFAYFAHVPDSVRTLFPPGRVTHTCEAVDFAPLAGKRVLIVGGRQSAFEWAALLRERGAEATSLSYRHDTPAFTASDWTWVGPLVDGTVADPGWFRRLTREGKEEVARRLWAEGRLKLEPWLAARIAQPGVALFPRTQPVACEEGADGALRVTLSDGTALAVDHVILATGYQVDLARVPMLSAGNLLHRIEVVEGCPVLDERFQSSVAGLFFTSMCATRDFGPFFAFTVSVRASAVVMGEALRKRGRA